MNLLVVTMEETISSVSATSADVHENDFQNTGRVGRRNAVPDILNADGTTTKASTSDLQEKLSALTTNDPNESSSKASKSETTSPK